MAIGSVYDREDKEAVEPLIHTLKKGNRGSRVRAAYTLGIIGDSRAVEPLIQALKDEDENVRMVAAEALGNIKDARAVEPLIQALKDGNWSYRRKITYALGMIGNLRAVEPLIQALKDECYQMKKGNIESIKNTLWALGKMGEPAAESLVQALKDKNSHFRWGAALALEKIGWQPKNTIEKILYLIGKSEWDKVAEVGKQAVEFLIQTLNDSNPHIRKEVAKALGKIEDRRAVEHLVPLLREKDPGDEKGEVLRAAAEALDKLGWVPENDLDKFYYLTAKREWEKLAEMGKVAVEPLLEALHYGWNYGLRVDAAETLGMIGDPRAVEPLVEILRDGNWESSYRCRAAEALGKIGEQTAVEPLRQILVGDEYFPIVRSCAAEALDKLGWKPRNNVEEAYYLVAKKEWEKVAEMGPVAVNPLIKALQSDDDEDEDRQNYVRKNAARALGMIGDVSAIDPLIEFLGREHNREVYNAAKEALKRLGREWKDEEY